MITELLWLGAGIIIGAVFSVQILPVLKDTWAKFKVWFATFKTKSAANTVSTTVVTTSNVTTANV